ncbi:MAG: hypothetical protein GEU98_19445 [Pseudonocardiaceae bacterium]|nr:hypothetical protein [Pseudonocardiaceae bacterium]
MTAPPPDPDPDSTPALDEGQGVPPGDTPPESGQTSGLSHREPRPPKAMPIVTIAVVLIVAALVAGFLFALGSGMLQLG